MGHKSIAALRAGNAALLLIIIVLVAVGKEVRVSKPRAWRFDMSGFSIGIDSWGGYKEGYALFFNQPPRGQFFVFFMSLIFMLVCVCLAVYAMTRSLRWKSSIVEVVLVTIMGIMCVLMFGVECWYASCWNWRTKQFTSTCLVQSWAAAAAFLVLSCILFLVDLLLSVKSLKADENPQSDYTPGTKISLSDIQPQPETVPSEKERLNLKLSNQESVNNDKNQSNHNNINNNHINHSPNMTNSTDDSRYTTTYSTNLPSYGLNRVQIAEAASQMTQATAHYQTGGSRVQTNVQTNVRTQYTRPATEV